MDIKKIRKKLEMNQAEFAELIKFSLRHVQRFESGETPISPQTELWIRTKLNA